MKKDKHNNLDLFWAQVHQGGINERLSQQMIINMHNRPPNIRTARGMGRCQRQHMFFVGSQLNTLDHCPLVNVFSSPFPIVNFALSWS